LPMEGRVDYLSLLNGETIEVPFELLLVFSTNIPPGELGDEAFFRRIRHKNAVGDPDEISFLEILPGCCDQTNISSADRRVRQPPVEALYPIRPHCHTDTYVLEPAVHDVLFVARAVEEAVHRDASRLRVRVVVTRDVLARDRVEIAGLAQQAERRLARRRSVG